MIQSASRLLSGRLGAGEKALFLGALSLSIFCAGPVSADEAATADSLGFSLVDGDTIWWTETCEVVGSRVPVGMSGINRSVGVIDESDLAGLPGRSPAEVLSAVPGVAVSQRQQYGTQADLSVRGSSFEQVQVLLDGIAVGDPQTGHHSLNLPLGLADVQRLEVLRGHGSTLYGANAFGGTVNIVTREPSDENRLRLGVMAGGNATWRAALGGDYVAGSTRTRAGVERFRSDGSYPNTDVDNWNANLRSTADTRFGRADIFAGFSRRAFGAQNYYGPFPAFEETETLFVSARLRRKLGDRVTFEPRLHFRRHEDHFELIRSNPDYYTNNHATRRVGAELRSLVELGRGHSLACGFEGTWEDLDSSGLWVSSPTSGLGQRIRRQSAVSIEIARRESPLRYQLGLRADLRDAYRMRISKSASGSWEFTPGLSLRGALGTMFRIPTWTELHYLSGTDRGDPSLEPEHGWAWDTGLSAWRGAWTASVTWFERYEQDKIDWVRHDGSAVFQAMNVGDYDTRGLEARATWTGLAGHSLGLSYMRLDRQYNLPQGYTPKYLILVPKDILALTGSLALPGGGRLGAVGRYMERNIDIDTGGQDFRHVFVLDLRLVTPRYGPGRLKLDISNMLDRPYTEIVQPSVVPMPGTLVTVGWEMEY